MLLFPSVFSCGVNVGTCAKKLFSIDKKVLWNPELELNAFSFGSLGPPFFPVAYTLLFLGLQVHQTLDMKAVMFPFIIISFGLLLARKNKAMQVSHYKRPLLIYSCCART